MYAKSEDQALTNSNLRKHNGTKTRKKNREEGNGRPPKEEQETQAEEKWEDNIRNEIGKENNRKREEVPDEEPKKNGKGTTLVVA